MPVVEQRIYLIRGQRVILDADLSELYGVVTGNLNRAVQRNLKRFPDSFTFVLNDKEFTDLRCQIGTAKRWSKRRVPPRAFTEHGAIMAANVLQSEQAVDMSVYVVEAFIKLREMVASNRQLAAKFAELEGRIEKHDETLVAIVDAIQQLVEEPKPKRNVRWALYPGNNLLPLAALFSYI